MRIESILLGAGPEGTRYPGKQYDVSEDEGRALVAGGAARRVETATAPPPAEAAPTPTEAETYAQTVTNPAHAKAEKRGKK